MTRLARLVGGWGREASKRDATVCVIDGLIIQVSTWPYCKRAEGIP